jgi:hypothetical protein
MLMAHMPVGVVVILQTVVIEHRLLLEVLSHVQYPNIAEIVTEQNQGL